MGLTLKELLMWPPEIAALAKGTREMAQTHSNSGDFYRSVVQLSSWQGQAADTAASAMMMIAGKHDVSADELTGAAGAMDTAESDAQKLADRVGNLLTYAGERPAIEVNADTNAVVAPDTSNLTDDAAEEVARKFADVEAQVTKLLADGETVDTELAQAITKATGVANAVSSGPTSLEDLLLPGVSKTPLKPGEVRNLGPVAGTGAYPGVPGIKAADLGEVITLPDGSKISVLGDSYADPHVAGPGNEHYPSTAVPVTFDENGIPHFGAPLTGTNANSGMPNEVPGPHTLFPLPKAAIEAGANNALPGGSVLVGKDTYMLVVGTNTSEGLAPKGSWLVKVTNDPGAGWQPIEGSYRSANVNAPAGTTYSPVTQISGYDKDGYVHIAADAFDRSQGVSMYRVAPEDFAHRELWQPYNPTDSSWGAAGLPATETITDPGVKFGELSFRDVEGHPVLSGFNATPNVNQVEIRVGAGSPTDVFGDPLRAPIVVAQQNNPAASSTYVYQPYGGYILPDATLANMPLFISQWNTSIGAPYDTQQVVVNASPP